MANNIDQINFSNNIINTKTIEGLIGLFEGDAVFDFWLANVASTSISESDKDELRRNFPRSGFLREVVLKLCWSIPMPKIEPSDDLDEAAYAAIEEKLDVLLNSEKWEGHKTFAAALPWWRAFVFVTGDLCVKLPVVDGTCYPTRMPSQNMQILMDPDVRKVIKGFRFRYKVGSDQYTDQGDETNQVVETIEEGAWTIEKRGKTTKQDTLDILPVAHMAWEEREEAPRGLPIALRLADKLLHVLSVTLDRRMGNKMGSVPMYKLLNASGTMPPRKPGAIVSLKTEVPFAPADFAAVSTGFTDASLRSEYVDALRELHEAAFLPFELDNNSGAVDKHSGKALQLLSKDQIKYREAFQAVESAFLKDLVQKALHMEGTELQDDDICVSYEPVVSPEPSERRADAQFYFDAGLEAKALEVMGNDEDEAKKMMAELEDKRAEALLAMQPAEGVDVVDGEEDAPPAKPGEKKPPVIPEKK